MKIIIIFIIALAINIIIFSLLNIKPALEIKKYSEKESDIKAKVFFINLINKQK